MINYQKYKLYKHKYKMYSGNKTRRQEYLDAITNRDCDKIKKSEAFFSNVYKKINKNYLFNRELFLRNENFSGKCGDFWEQIKDNDGNGWRSFFDDKLKDESISESKDEPTSRAKTESVEKETWYGELFRKYKNFLKKKDIQLIKENQVLLLKNKKISNIYCLILKKTRDFLYLLYNDKSETIKQDIVFSYTNLNGDPLPLDSGLFNINGDLSESNIRECNLESFLYGKEISPNLRKTILVYLEKEKKSKFNHWAIWLLGTILNLLFKCLGCLDIYLDDASIFNRLQREGKMNCGYRTVTYQSAKNRPPFYQSLGFRADPPINFSNLKKIMDLKVPQEYQEEFSSKDIFIEKKDKDGRTYYINFTTGIPVWGTRHKKITSINQLLTVEQIHDYLEYIGVELDDTPEILKELNDLSVYDKSGTKRYVTLDTLIDFLNRYQMPFTYSSFKDIISPHQLKEYRNFLISNKRCLYCGKKLKPYSYLAPDTKVVITKTDFKDQFALVDRILHNVSETENDVYNVKIIGNDNLLSLYRNEISPIRCYECEYFSGTERYKVITQNYISLNKLNEYTAKFIGNLKSNYYYIKHPDKLNQLDDKLMDSILEIPEFFPEYIVYSESIHKDKIINLKNFINWHTTLVRSTSETTKLQQMSVDIRERNFPAAIASKPINFDILTQVVGNHKVRTHIRNIIRSDCVCPYCFYVNSNNLEIFIESIGVKKKSSDLMYDLIVQNQDLISYIMTTIHRYNYLDVHILFDYLEPSFTNLLSKYTKINVQYIDDYIIISNSQNKVICLIPRLIDYNIFIDSCKHGVCKECYTPLSNKKNTMLKLDFITGRYYYSISPKIHQNTSNNKIITILPKQKKLNLYQMLEIRYPYQDWFINYPVTIIGSREIPKIISGYYKSCKYGPNTNVAPYPTRETVTEYLVRFLDKRLDCWVLLSNKVWRFYDYNWEYLIKGEILHSKARKLEEKCKQCMPFGYRFQDLSPGESSSKIQIVNESNLHKIGKVIEINKDTKLADIRQRLIEESPNGNKIEYSINDGSKYSFLIDNLSFLLLAPNGDRYVIERSMEERIDWFKSYIPIPNDKNDIYSIYVNIDEVISEGGSL